MGKHNRREKLEHLQAKFQRCQARLKHRHQAKLTRDWEKVKTHLIESRLMVLQARQDSMNAATAEDSHKILTERYDAFKKALNSAIEAASSEVKRLTQVKAMRDEANETRRRLTMLLCMKHSCEPQCQGLTRCDSCDKRYSYTFYNKSTNPFHCTTCFSK